LIVNLCCCRARLGVGRRGGDDLGAALSAVTHERAHREISEASFDLRLFDLINDFESDQVFEIVSRPFALPWPVARNPSKEKGRLLAKPAQEGYEAKT
jgi:hypothetical protein